MKKSFTATIACTAIMFTSSAAIAAAQKSPCTAWLALSETSTTFPEISCAENPIAVMPGGQKKALKGRRFPMSAASPAVRSFIDQVNEQIRSLNTGQKLTIEQIDQGRALGTDAAMLLDRFSSEDGNAMSEAVDRNLIEQSLKIMRLMIYQSRSVVEDAEREKARAEAEKAAQEAEAKRGMEEARMEAERRARAIEAEERRQADTAAGFEIMTVNDLILDYPAKPNGAKVILTGFLTAIGRLEMLSASEGSSNFVYVETSSLSLETRKRALDCRDRTLTCTMTVRAHVGCRDGSPALMTGRPCIVIDDMRRGTYDDPVREDVLR